MEVDYRLNQPRYQLKRWDAGMVIRVVWLRRETPRDARETAAELYGGKWSEWEPERVGG